MKKFTVSEVRNWKRAYKGTGAAEIFDAFADMLEAQEKAVPVMVVNHVSSAEHDLPIGMKLYTHPAPADAEPPSSLQEALCVLENAALHGLVLHGDDIPRLRATVDKIAPDKPQPDAERLAEALRKIAEFDCGCVPCVGECRKGRAAEIELQARMEIAREALAAHSAQAQPPAASVTDAMVDAALTRAVIASKESGIKGPTRYMMRAALEAALAAQENPNG